MIRPSKHHFLLIILMSMTFYNSFAYDIAVENADGVTIYYNYINEGKELEVTYLYLVPNLDNKDHIFYKDTVVIPKEVTIMDKTLKVTSIGSYAFSNCKKLTAVIIPNSVKTIGEAAFTFCHGLNSVIIPKGVTSIKWCAFWDCESLTSVTIPQSVTSIGEYAFYGCEKISTLYSLITKPFAINGSEESDGVVFSPQIFRNATLYVPIGTYDKYKNTEGWKQFKHIEEFEYYDDSEYAVIDDIKYRLLSDNECEVVNYDGDSDYIEIPEQVTANGKGYIVTAIADFAFDSCKDLSSVSIGNNIVSIGKRAFFSCSGLTSVTIPNSVTIIGYGAFAECSGLTFVIIPNSVTSIGEKAFIGCSNLSSVTIGSGVTSIGNYAFDGTNIQTVISLISNPFTINSNIFSQQTYQKAILYVPKGTKAKYKANGGWNNFTYIAEEGEVIDISEGFVEFEVNGIKYQTVSSTECEIISGRDCSGNIEIPEKVISNGKEYKVTAIGKDAFDSSRLTSIIIPQSVTFIGANAFRKSYYLTSVVIPNSVTFIGEWAFMGTGLTSITIPNGVTTLEESIFNGCDNLSSVSLPNNLSAIGYKAFYRCLNLKSINFPNNLTSIGELAFWECKSLTSITIPNSVTSMGANAFDGEGEDIPNIQTITSLIENPFEIYGKSSYKSPNGKDYLGVFNPIIFNNAILYVPKGTINKYKATNGWKDFLYIEEGTGPNGGETPKKCSTPTISYQNGKLIFRCDTEGATCQYSITDDDVKSGSSNEIQLGVTYCINVYATKTGYVNSETATATLCWIDAEPKTEGITNVAQIRAKAVMIQSNGNVLSVSSADEGTEINVFDTAGRKVGSGRATSNVTNIFTTLNSGEVGIVKIGEKVIKVLMK